MRTDIHRAVAFISVTLVSKSSTLCLLLMPSLPKIFNRRSSSDLKRHRPKSNDIVVPDVPAIPPQEETSRPLDRQRVVSLPMLVLSPTSLSEDLNITLSPQNSPELSTNDSSRLNAPPQIFPRSPVSPMVFSDRIWQGSNNPNANVSKSERVLNQVSKLVGACFKFFSRTAPKVYLYIIDGAVTTSTQTSGVVGFVKTVVANEEIQAIGKTILDGVPAIMSALEALMEVHPFLKGMQHAFAIRMRSRTFL